MTVFFCGPVRASPGWPAVAGHDTKGNANRGCASPGFRGDDCAHAVGVPSPGMTVIESRRQAQPSCLNAKPEFQIFVMCTILPFLNCMTYT
jgi:hypothetical protein